MSWIASTTIWTRCWTICSPQYLTEGKAHLVVAIGCTGGRHRSVAIAEHLARRYGDAAGYLVEVLHRDVTRPA